MTRDEMGALDRNIQLRNGRRALPRVIPMTRKQAFVRTSHDLATYACIAACLAIGLYAALSMADEQIRVEAQINQEIWH